MPTAETKFTLLSYRTGILFFTFRFYFFILLWFYYNYFILLFSSFHLLFFFFCLISMFDWFSLFSLSYCTLISLPSLYSYSNNTLPLIFYFLFFLFRSYIPFHINVFTIPTQHTFLVLVHFTIFLSLLLCG